MISRGASSAEVAGDGQLDIERIVDPADAAGRADLAVALTKDTLTALAGRAAGALLVPPDAPRPDGATVSLFIQATTAWRSRPSPPCSIAGRRTARASMRALP